MDEIISGPGDPGTHVFVAVTGLRSRPGANRTRLLERELSVAISPLSPSCPAIVLDRRGRKRQLRNYTARLKIASRFLSRFFPLFVLLFLLLFAPFLSIRLSPRALVRTSPAVSRGNGPEGSDVFSGSGARIFLRSARDIGESRARDGPPTGVISQAATFRAPGCDRFRVPPEKLCRNETGINEEGEGGGEGVL